MIENLTQETQESLIKTIKAIKINNFEEIKKEIDAGADVNKILILLFEDKHFRLIETLLKSIEVLPNNDLIKEIKKIDEFGKTLLHDATRFARLKTIEFLINAGADVNQQDIAGKTALHLVPCNTDYYYTETLIKCYSLLVKAGADPNICDNYGKNAIYNAVLADNEQIINILVKAGANVNKVCDYGRTALHRAIEYGKNDAVSALIKNGVDVNQVYSNNRSPLYLACEKNNVKAVRALLEAGADVNIKTDRNWSPKLFCEYHGRNNILNLFEEKATYKAIYDDLLVNELSETFKKQYYENECLAIDNEKEKFLIKLVSKPKAENDLLRIKKLLNKTIHKNHFLNSAIDKIDFLKTKEKLFFLKKLLDEGVNIDYQNNIRETALMNAVHKIDFVKFLLENNANVNLLDNQNETALIKAVKQQYFDIANLLIKYNADINICNKRGWSFFKYLDLFKHFYDESSKTIKPLQNKN
jgi:ankyrin repeat protein